jgi:hypothetical protein
MAAIRVQIWLNPHSIVALDEGRPRRPALQLPHFNKDRELCSSDPYVDSIGTLAHESY